MDRFALGFAMIYVIRGCCALKKTRESCWIEGKDHLPEVQVDTSAPTVPTQLWLQRIHDDPLATPSRHISLLDPFLRQTLFTMFTC